MQSDLPLELQRQIMMESNIDEIQSFCMSRFQFLA